MPHCVCCDHWDRVADNLAAIAKHLEAVQGQLRWGVADLAQMLVGFRIAPLPRERPPWWEVLGFRDRPTLLELIRLQRRALAARYHPDRGGSGARMAEINQAYQEGSARAGRRPRPLARERSALRVWAVRPCADRSPSPRASGEREG